MRRIYMKVLKAGMACIALLISLPAWSLETTIKLESRVTGNQEQPTVLYIVPWKSPESVGGLKQPLSSKISRVFRHIERAELQREIKYRKSIGVVAEQ